MKKLPIVLNTPARVVIAVGLIVLVGEFLIMLLIESIQAIILKDGFLGNIAWKFVDPIMLTAIVSPALYFLIFRPLNQQAEIERQLDELRRFQKLTIGRELRMKELVEENAALRNPLAAEPAGDIPVTSGSLEAPQHAAEQPTATQPIDESQRSALLFMLKDLENAQQQIERAHQEWIAALDVVNDPIFLHDKQFRILRCNKAYQQRAGIPFHEIIGQPYYEVFPKTGAPLPCCLRVMEKAETAADEEEMVFGDATYRSRTFSVYSEQGAYLHSAHILEDITKRKQTEAQLKNSEERYRQIIQTSMDGFWITDTNGRILDVNDAYCQLIGYAREVLLNMRIPDVEAKETPEETAQHTQEVMTKGYARFETRHRRKDGQLLDIEVSVVHQPDKEDGRFFIFLRDITERKRAQAELQEMLKAANESRQVMLAVVEDQRLAEEALRKSNERFDLAAKGAKDGIWDWDIETNTNYFSPRFLELLDYGPGELAYELTTFDYLLHPEDRTWVFDRVRQHLEDKVPYNVEYRLRTKNGEYRWFQARGESIRDESGKPFRMAGSITDITERKQAEAQITQSLSLLYATLESTKDAILVVDLNNTWVLHNQHFVDLWHITAEIIAAKDDRAALSYVLNQLEDTDSFLNRVHELYAAPEASSFDIFKFNDGKIIERYSMPQRIDGKVVGRVWSFRDITAHKQAEEKLRETRDYLENLFNHANAPIIVWDPSYQITMFNHAFEHLTGRDANEVIGKQIDTLFPADRRDEALSHIYQTQTGERWKTVEIPILHKSGEVRTALWNSATLYSADGKNVVATMAQGQDITERKRAESAVEHAHRALATLGMVNRELVHATVEEELLRAICQAIVTQRGYQMAWVGYVQHDESNSIKIMASAGHDEGYLDAMQITWAETERGMGPSGRAVRGGATQVCQDIASDPQYLPWRDEALKRGYAANIALPLMDGSGKVFGILHVYAEEANAFTSNEIALLEEMAGDLAFGVRSLHTRHERDLALVKNQEQLVQLQDSLENTMLAIARIVEMRDPYTAGHQVRVADLAAAIARQMGLPEEQVHAIHLAGTVHDLGKIRIPAEILSKPGRITDIEYSLIKIHPHAGYDILKDIAFPWPIAQMVLQHHERIDGSGYPQGLKGDAILLEARILAVADVVEAIYSHRPYRPGLGIEAALGEITRGRGTHYDPQVVDACVALIREQGYVLPG